MCLSIYLINLLPDSWIITSGTDAGIMKTVGQAVKEYLVTSPHKRPVVLGMEVWDKIHNNGVLYKDKVFTFTFVT